MFVLGYGSFLLVSIVLSESRGADILGVAADELRVDRPGWQLKRIPLEDLRAFTLFQSALQVDFEGGSVSLPTRDVKGGFENLDEHLVLLTAEINQLRGDSGLEPITVNRITRDHED